MGKQVTDLSGKIFGNLTVIRMNGSKHGHANWICVCDCGNTIEVIRTNLLSGGTHSCGCQNKKRLMEIHTKHGQAKRKNRTSEYEIWKKMKARCLNKNNASYKHYGGRGIKICDSWIYSFEEFIKDMGKRPSINHSIERIDVNGNYEISNCIWATIEEHNRNKRPRKSKTGEKGVYWRNSISKYQVYISLNRKQISLGVYDNIEDAINARKKGEEHYWK